MTATSQRRVFLSASIPLPSRNPMYFSTADVVAIRDAVRAFVIVMIEEGIQCIFGGHPAISPMVRLQIAQTGLPVGDKVVMFQSRFFKREFPNDNKAFERVVLTKAINGDRDQSLVHMREEMLAGEFLCGIFIGGMEGVETEYDLFCARHSAPAFPIASTGAAAARIFQAQAPLQGSHPELQTEVSYITLMRKLMTSIQP